MSLWCMSGPKWIKPRLIVSHILLWVSVKWLKWHWIHEPFHASFHNTFPGSTRHIWTGLFKMVYYSSLYPSYQGILYFLMILPIIIITWFNSFIKIIPHYSFIRLSIWSSNYSFPYWLFDCLFRIAFKLIFFWVSFCRFKIYF